MSKAGPVLCHVNDPRFYALMQLLCLEGRHIAEFTLHAVAGEILTLETVELVYDAKGQWGENETTDNHKYVLIEEQAAKDAGLI